MSAYNSIDASNVNDDWMTARVLATFEVDRVNLALTFEIRSVSPNTDRQRGNERERKHWRWAFFFFYWFILRGTLINCGRYGKCVQNRRMTENRKKPMEWKKIEFIIKEIDVLSSLSINCRRSAMYFQNFFRVLFIFMVFWAFIYSCRVAWHSMKGERRRRVGSDWSTRVRIRAMIWVIKLILNGGFAQKRWCLTVLLWGECLSPHPSSSSVCLCLNALSSVFHSPQFKAKALESISNTLWCATSQVIYFNSTANASQSSDKIIFRAYLISWRERFCWNRNTHLLAIFKN